MGRGCGVYLPTVPAAPLVRLGGCRLRVARATQAASSLRVVGIQALRYELTSAEWVVVGDGGWCRATSDADRVSSQHALTESTAMLVPVAALASGATLTVAGSRALLTLAGAWVQSLARWAARRWSGRHSAVLSCPARSVPLPFTVSAPALVGQGRAVEAWSLHRRSSGSSQLEQC